MVSSSVRLGVVGCGAVFRNCHLPALREVRGVVITSLVDSDRGRAEDAAAAIAEIQSIRPAVVESLDTALADIDAALVCTANASHAEIAADLLRAGKHVLVEKPFATAVADCDLLIKLQRQTGLVVAVGHVRRLFPVAPWVAKVLADGVLGTIKRLDWTEGDVFAWPVMSQAMFRADQAGGGVVMDIGVHVLDTLMMWLGDDVEFVDYTDDSAGGVESEASIKLRVGGTETNVYLSRLRRLGASCEIAGSTATLRVDTGFEASYEIRSTSGYVVESGIVPIVPPAAVEWSGLYAGQLRSFINAITGDAQPLADAMAGRRTVAITRRCYSSPSRGGMRHSWARLGTRTPRLAGRRIAVTGATGFLGSRLVETLAGATDAEVLAIVRNYRSLSRLSTADQASLRFASVDITSAVDLATVLAGTDTVVHCAYGNAGSVDERWRVSVDGTQAVVKASIAAGVRKLVHVSSMSVYESTGAKTVTETSRYLRADETDREYDQQKLEAEKRVMEAAAAGLEPVVIQPGIIYGPGSPWWTINPLRRLAENPCLLPSADGEDSGGVCNAVYVDDVVQALLLAAELPAAVGARFIVSGPTPVSWGEFYDHYRRMLGVLCSARDMPFLPDWEQKFYARQLTASIEHVRSALGYQPEFGLAAGMAQVRPWARWQALLPAGKRGGQDRRPDGEA